MSRVFNVSSLLLIVLAISCRSSAQEWRFLGLGNEPINVITVDWSNPQVIYAGSGSDFSAGTVGGIFKTTTGGAAWDTLLRGVTVRDIDIHPRDPNILYATLGINALTVPGIAKSLDGGKTWFSASSGIRMNWEEGPGDLVIDLLNPDTLYTGTGGFSGAPYKSTNGGLLWFRIDPDSGWVWSWDSMDSTLYDPLEHSIASIAMDPTDTEHLYFGTDGFGDLVETRDGGRTWNETGLIQSEVILQDIEIDPFHPKHIYVGTSVGSPNAGILFSADGGQSFTNINNNLTARPIAVPKLQFYINDGNSYLYIIGGWADGGIYVSDHENWRKVGINALPVANTISILGNHIYAGYDGENLGGVYVLELLTNVNRPEDSQPKLFSLSVFPNPSRSTLTLVYNLTQMTPLRVEIFDVLGRKKELLLQTIQTAGEHQYAACLSALPSGIYFLRMATDRDVISKKIVILK